MIALLVVLLYVLVLIGVGWHSSRKVSGSTDFLLAGRRLGPVILVGTLVATWTGTGSIFGNAEEAYGVGLPSLVLPLASMLGIFALLIMVPRIRRRDRFTLQDVLEESYGPWARVLGTVTLVSAYLVIVSYQLRAANAVLEGVLDGVFREAAASADGEASMAGSVAHAFASAGAWLDHTFRSMGVSVEHGDNTAGLLLLALLIAGYTALAGLMSVALTDTMNGLLMLLGVGIALPLVWMAAVHGLEQAALASGGVPPGEGVIRPVLEALPESARHVTGHYSTVHILSILLPAFLLVMGDANLHQRFLAAGSAKAARRAALLFIPAVLVVDALILLTAVAGRVVLPGIENPGHIILRLALEPGILPPLLGGLLVASILAVIVSTADSYLLSSSASLVRDVFQRFLKREASERSMLVVARVVVVVLTGCAFVMALQSSRFFEISLFAYTIYGVGITPALVAALFWKRATRLGALASMIAGPLTAILWKVFGWNTVLAQHFAEPELEKVSAVVPAICVSTVVLFGLSVSTTSPDRSRRPG
ncbi:MAG: sodium:solute symporter family protein [Planctomycetota bacterium]|nr:sodium:solute symporter family protein [Planctomycetota bacterium]